jgi:hypothetical protein
MPTALIGPFVGGNGLSATLRIAASRGQDHPESLLRMAQNAFFQASVYLPTALRLYGPDSIAANGFFRSVCHLDNCRPVIELFETAGMRGSVDRIPKHQTSDRA